MHTSRPLAELAPKLGLYAWLIGSWQIEVKLRQKHPSIVAHRGTIHAGWVLEGRAIQDVFAVPGMFYGTSLRFYDPAIDAWQVFWIDLLKQVFFRMIGRAQGNEIVNEGQETPELARAYGRPIDSAATLRWIFSEITPRSFRWRSERSTDGKLWSLEREYLAERTG